MTATPPTPADRTRPLVRGALALELAGGSQPAQAALRQAEAGALAERIGRDLGRLAPAATALDLTFAAAHFDPAELLRPGWPLHRRLEELHARAPKSPGPRLIALGADAEGRVPQPLQADPDLHGGPLRVLPFLLTGEADAVAAVSSLFEETLLESGMAGADTALLAQESLGARIEHARYLTAYDLAAMMALQYDHAGLEPLWPLIETALLAPEGEYWLDAPPEPLLRYADGEVRMAGFDRETWRARHAPGEGDDARIDRGFGFFQARQRQIAAVLQGHGIDVRIVVPVAGDDPRAALA